MAQWGAAMTNAPHWLALEQFDRNNISEFEAAWLTKRGVTFKALMGDWPVCAANVTFDGAGHFDLCNVEMPTPPGGEEWIE
jgi:hypothetical protein